MGLPVRREWTIEVPDRPREEPLTLPPAEPDEIPARQPEEVPA